MMCVICISRGGSASVSFSEVEERAVDLRKVSTVLSQSEPTRYVGPNITGTFTHNGLEKNNLKTTGAFYHAGQGAHGEGSGYPGATIGFNSNLTNSIYSDVINTVQPPSLVTLACIKT